MADLQKVSEIYVQFAYSVPCKQKVSAVFVQFAYVEAIPRPAISTDAATSVGETGAQLNGELTDMGDEAAVDCYFQYRVQGEEDWIATADQELTETGTFNAALSGLDAETTYEFRACVAWGEETDEGDTLTFETAAAAVSGAGLFFAHG